ncbi:transmembrane protein 179 [Hyalella azteca]|uniref:Transmembrane protein 179 n=1 Tax=Hyalella azteca TaxID=294128 RepID=A0A8B7NEW7_HYAAZ|nr:transmembrane protein 179 [Hyalella azteca]
MSEPSFFSDTLTLVQVAGYVVAVIFGLCALVPTILHLIDFEGHCLLFTNGTWQASDGQFVADWGSQFYCDYNIFWSFFSVLIALTQLVIFAKNAKRNTSKGFLTVLGDLVVCTLVCILVFAGAVMTSVGYNRWCDAILQRFTECEDAASPTTGIDRKDGINTAHFYIHYGIIQFGAWSCWPTWVALSLFVLSRFISLHQDYVIRVSMARERARLCGDPSQLLT